MEKELGNAICGHCNSSNTIGLSRIVGYYSIIENWNTSKKAELVDRQKGTYGISEDLPIMLEQETLIVA